MRAGEERLVASAFFALLGITAAHAMLETARDALFLAKLPTSHLTAMYLAIAGLGLLLSRAGGSRTRAAKRVHGVAWSLALASLVSAAFWVALRHGSPPWLLYGLYIWTGTFSSWLVLRFWLLLGSALTAAQARRLFGVIGTGSVLGAVMGAGMARVLVHSADVRVLLVASVVLLATALGPAIWLSRCTPSELALAPDTARSSLQADVRLIRDSPYLSRVLAMALVSTVALTIVDYLFKAAVAARGGSVEDMAAFLASTYFVLNLAALVVQGVGVGALLRFRGANLRGANLAGARLRGARFDGADLRSANLSGADARGAVFDHALLEGANLDATNFLGARGVGAVLARCTGTSTCFESGNWNETDFSHCQLETPNFDNASVRGARFAHGKLKSAHFNASGLADVVFDDADLQGARLTNTAVVSCSLERARLSGSHWELSGIERSQFNDSHCAGMTWLRCEAKGVAFRASDLAGSTWKESKVRSSDFSHARLTTASLVDIDFLRTSFAFAQLSHVVTTRLQLIACNLEGAETPGTVLPRNLLALLARKHPAR